MGSSYQINLLGFSCQNPKVSIQNGLVKTTSSPAFVHLVESAFFDVYKSLLLYKNVAATFQIGYDGELNLYGYELVDVKPLSVLCKKKLPKSWKFKFKISSGQRESTQEIPWFTETVEDVVYKMDIEVERTVSEMLEQQQKPILLQKSIHDTNSILKMVSMVLQKPFQRSTFVKDIQLVYQLCVTIPLRPHKKKKKIKSPKSWVFKYKSWKEKKGRKDVQCLFFADLFHLGTARLSCFGFSFTATIRRPYEVGHGNAGPLKASVRVMLLHVQNHWTRGQHLVLNIMLNEWDKSVAQVAANWQNGSRTGSVPTSSQRHYSCEHLGSFISTSQSAEHPRDGKEVPQVDAQFSLQLSSPRGY